MDLQVTVYWLAYFNVWHIPGFGDMFGQVDLYPYSVGIKKYRGIYILGA